MTVTRTNPAGLYTPAPHLSQVVVTEGARLAHLSGQVAWDADGRLVGAGDHVAQARQIARNLDTALAAVGGTRDDLVEETVFVVDHTPDLLPALFAALRDGSSAAPASTLVGVPTLFAPGYLIEVRAIAALRAG